MKHVNAKLFFSLLLTKANVLKSMIVDLVFASYVKGLCFASFNGTRERDSAN